MMQRRIAAIVLCLLLHATAVLCMAAETEKPTFSIPGGFYQEPIQVALEGPEGSQIYYTTDGSAPSAASLHYDAPITIEGVRHSPRMVQGVVPQSREPQGTVLRAVAIGTSGAVSPVATSVYWVDAEMPGRYGLPIVSVTISEDDLWHEERGIYTNYMDEHNVPAEVAYFAADGTLGFAREVEVKVSGHGSRSNAKKSMRIYFTKGDTSQGKYMEFDLIPGTVRNYYDDAPVEKFAKVTLRISDWTGTNLRDVMVQRMGSFLRPDTAHSVPVAYFLNGEFWGIYECREQYDERYVEAHYDVDKDAVVYFDRDWTLLPQKSILRDTGTVYTDKLEYSAGPEDGNEDGVLGESYYRELHSYVKSLTMEQDMGDPSVYRQWQQYVDEDNFIDYLIAYLYTANDDWPGNNYKFWRVTEEAAKDGVYGGDGKFRYMIHDFDIAFEDPNHATLNLSFLSTMDEQEARHPAFATSYLNGCLRAEPLRNTLLQRQMAYLATLFDGAHVRAMAQELTQARQASKQFDMLRWNLGSGTSAERTDRWLRNMESFGAFADARRDALTAQYVALWKEQFGVETAADATFHFTVDPSRGYLSVAGAEISPSRYGDTAAAFTTVQMSGIPLSISAVSDAGYRVKEYHVTHNGEQSVVTGDTLTLTPEAGEYAVEVVWEEGAPAEDLFEGELCVLRAESFQKLRVGEKWPITLSGRFQSGWRRVYQPEVRIADGFEHLLQIDGAIVTPQRSGTTQLSVTYDGVTVQLPCTIE